VPTEQGAARLEIRTRLLHTSAVTEIIPELIRINPIWDPILSDPRFVELLGKKRGNNPHASCRNWGGCRGAQSFACAARHNWQLALLLRRKPIREPCPLK
jgi:hypothetical protein